MLNPTIPNRDCLLLLFETVSDAVIATDKNLVVTFWNKAAEEIFGYTSEELIGKRMGHIIPTEYAGALEEVFRTGMTEEFSKGELIITAKNGRRINIAASSTMIRNDHGDITGVVGIYRDVTNTKILERFRAQLGVNSDIDPGSKDAVQVYHEEQLEELTLIRQQLLQLVTQSIFNKEEEVQVIDDFIQTINGLMNKVKELSEND